ncbi:MAG: helix-turn-helix transcriptional regulator [Mycobacterium sp.]
MADEVQESLEQIGATLRDARVRAFMTQGEVGQRAGVSRQLVSRIEQGCNGEISAYLAVAGALQHRFTVVEEAVLIDDETPGLDFKTG